MSNTIAVSTLKGPTIAAVVIKDLVRRLPHRVLDDGVSPNAYRTNFYGNFPFATLNRQVFKDRQGNPIVFIHYESNPNLYAFSTRLLRKSTDYTFVFRR